MLDRSRRCSRRKFLAQAAALTISGGVGAGGYLALRSHMDSQATARRDADAVEAAKDCVAATQAPFQRTSHLVLVRNRD